MHSQGLPVYLRLGDIDKAKVKFLAHKSGESSKELLMIPRRDTANKELLDGTHARKSEELLCLHDLAQHHIGNALTRLHFGFLD